MSIAEKPISVAEAKNLWGIKAKSREDDIVASNGWQGFVTKLSS
jgi:hypothetical protein